MSESRNVYEDAARRAGADDVPLLVLCDVDGTLIDPSQEITDSIRNLAVLIREHHIPFTIASGRCRDTMQQYADALGITLPFLINNGAGARWGDQVLWDDLFPAACLKKAILRADEMDMTVIMGYGDRELVYRCNDFIRNEIRQYGRYNWFHIPLESEWQTLRFERVMLRDSEKPGRMKEIVPYLEPFRDQIEWILYDDRHLDIMKKGVSKAGGMTRLSEILKIPVERIMVIGDSMNDLEMVRQAGFGAAVGNAKEALKEQADYVSSAFYTDGVIEAVRFRYRING